MFRSSAYVSSVWAVVHPDTVNRHIWQKFAHTSMTSAKRFRLWFRLIRDFGGRTTGRAGMTRKWLFERYDGKPTAAIIFDHYRFCYKRVQIFAPFNIFSSV